jgi:hypothetical protein
VKNIQKTMTISRRCYAEFMAKGIPDGRRPDLVVGGHLRSVDGINNVLHLSYRL